MSSSVNFYFDVIEGREVNQSINSNNTTATVNETLNKQKILYILNKKTNERKIIYANGIQNRDQNLERSKRSFY